MMVISMVVMITGFASASQVFAGVRSCDNLDSGRISTGGARTLTIHAPEDGLISGYCIETAGSSSPRIVTLETPVESVKITAKSSITAYSAAYTMLTVGGFTLRDKPSDDPTPDPGNKTKIVICHVEGNGSAHPVDVDLSAWRDGTSNHSHHEGDYEAINGECPDPSPSPSPSPTDNPEKIEICHMEGNGGFTLIEVDLSAWKDGTSDHSQHEGDVEAVEGVCPDDPNPSIDINKTTVGGAGTPGDGVEITVGDTVTWSYLITNTGNVPLTGIAVSDDQGVTVTCPAAEMLPAETMTCTATGTAVLGAYSNIGSVTGSPPKGSDVTDTDSSSYTGVPVSTPPPPPPPSGGGGGGETTTTVTTPTPTETPIVPLPGVVETPPVEEPVITPQPGTVEEPIPPQKATIPQAAHAGGGGSQEIPSPLPALALMGVGALGLLASSIKLFAGAKS